MGKRIDLRKMPADASDREMYLRKEIRLLGGQIKRLRQENGDRKEFQQQIIANLVAADPYPLFKYKPAQVKKDVEIVPVFLWSDWHIGQKISRVETEGFNAFNFKIAERRFFQLVEDFLHWVDLNRTVYLIKQAAIFGIGDYISGDIHDELRRTNEWPLPVQSAKAGLMMAEGLRIIAAHFDEVVLYGIGADNHARLNPKPQYKQKAANSMSFVVHTIVDAETRKVENLKKVFAESMKYVANVNGFRFLIEHGDTTKAWNGIPQYGITRMRARESEKRMNTNKGFHYQAIGHWHVPNLLENKTIINGSLSGTDELDEGQGRHAKPAQVAFFVHPRHGIFNLTPFGAE